MVKMGARAGHREAGDRGALASRWLSVVLGLPFSPPSWPAEKSPPNFRNSSALWQRRNPTWGAPRTHGELLKLGFEISECTVSRYLDRMNRHRDSGKRWLTFLKNHREMIATMDFFTVPTATLRVLYCFFVVAARLTMGTGNGLHYFRGTVQRFDDRAGYGFIEADDGPDMDSLLLVHRKSLRRSHMTLQARDRVLFSVQMRAQRTLSNGCSRRSHSAL